MPTLLVLPLWLATLGWCTWQCLHLPFGPRGLLGWTLSTGVIGGVLLTSVGYQGFKIEHVRGHHLHVATPEDSSSARLGESVYAFVPRALWRNVRNAWQLAAWTREARSGRGATRWSWYTR